LGPRKPKTCPGSTRRAVGDDAGDLSRQLAAYTTTGQFIKGLRYMLQGISGHAETAPLDNT